MERRRRGLQTVDLASNSMLSPKRQDQPLMGDYIRKLGFGINRAELGSLTTSFRSPPEAVDHLTLPGCDADRDRSRSGSGHVFGIEHEQVASDEFDDAGENAFDHDHVQAPFTRS